MPTYSSRTCSVSTSATLVGWGFSLEELELRDGYAEVRVSGVGAKRAFARESGNHRHQRIPPTERRGRVHSSTITVAVLPEPDITEVEIKAHEVRFEPFRASGSGGQHRNTTDSAIRAIHIATGITAISALKSQHRNKELAFATLRARVADARRRGVIDAIANSRRQMVGSGSRCGEKIRTVSEQHGHVKDHVSGKKLHIDRYKKGFVEELAGE